jgi:hypothetical protein
MASVGLLPWHRRRCYTCQRPTIAELEKKRKSSRGHSSILFFSICGLRRLPMATSTSIPVYRLMWASSIIRSPLQAPGWLRKRASPTTRGYHKRGVGSFGRFGPGQARAGCHHDHKVCFGLVDLPRLETHAAERGTQLAIGTARRGCG